MALRKTALNGLNAVPWRQTLTAGVKRTGAVLGLAAEHWLHGWSDGIWGAHGVELRAIEHQSQGQRHIVAVKLLEERRNF